MVRRNLALFSDGQCLLLLGRYGMAVYTSYGPLWLGYS